MGMTIFRAISKEKEIQSELPVVCLMMPTCQTADYNENSATSFILLVERERIVAPTPKVQLTFSAFFGVTRKRK